MFTQTPKWFFETLLHYTFHMSIHYGANDCGEKWEIWWKLGLSFWLHVCTQHTWNTVSAPHLGSCVLCAEEVEVFWLLLDLETTCLYLRGVYSYATLIYMDQVRCPLFDSNCTYSNEGLLALINQKWPISGFLFFQNHWVKVLEGWLLVVGT